MDINEDKIKSEVSSFLASLQRLLPKKNDIVLIEPRKQKMTRLSDVHAEAKNVFPRCFIGARLIVLREIMDRVKLVQQYNYGKPKESYKCFTQMIHKELEPKCSDRRLLVDMSGSATATYREVVDGSYEMRITSKIRDLISSETEIELEKGNEKTLGTISCAMKDVDPGTTRVVTQWMHKVLPDVCIGMEMSCKPLAFPSMPAFSFSARYDKPSFALSSTISKTGFQVCLFKRFAPDLRVAMIANEGYRGEPPVFGVALHKDYQNGSDFKVFIDSQRCGGFTFQRELLFSVTQDDVRVLRLTASSLIDRQRRVRFGFGFNLDF